MKHKTIVFCFSLCFIGAVIIMTLAQKYCLDNIGFIISSRTGWTSLCIGGIAFCAVAAFLLGFRSHRLPKKMPIDCKLLAVVSAICALYYAYASVNDIITFKALYIIEGITYLIFAAFLVMLAVSNFTKSKTPLPNWFALLCIPVWPAKLIKTFVSFSGSSVIFETTLIIVSLCVTLIFFLCVAKAYANVYIETNIYRLFPIGLAAAVLSIVYIAPFIISHFSEMTFSLSGGIGFTSVHSYLLSDFTPIFDAALIIAIVFSTYSDKNLDFKHQGHNTAFIYGSHGYDNYNSDYFTEKNDYHYSEPEEEPFDGYIGNDDKK